MSEMFVVDLIAASVLAIVLTIGFAALVRSDRRIRELSASVCIMAVASWIMGILVVAFGPAMTGTHWLPFAVTGLVVGVLVLGLANLPEFHSPVRATTGQPRSEVRPVIAMYFIATVLLFFCAVSLRFYLVNLS